MPQEQEWEHLDWFGQLMTWETMSNQENHIILLIKIILLHFILPGLIAWITSYILRKKNIIKDGDMKLQEEQKGTL